MLTLLSLLTRLLYFAILGRVFIDITTNREYILAILIKLVHIVFIIIITRYGRFTKYVDDKSLYVRSTMLISLQIILYITITYTAV